LYTTSESSDHRSRISTDQAAHIDDRIDFYSSKSSFKLLTIAPVSQDVLAWWKEGALMLSTVIHDNLVVTMHEFAGDKRPT
jgi:hypothetical protein